MKIIEAMKRIKSNKGKIGDLHIKISECCANLTFETPLYGVDTKHKIESWIQTCCDLTQDNVRLLTAIARTNLATKVEVELGGKFVTKSIAEWIWRRREYAQYDMQTYQKLTDRGLREGHAKESTGTVTEVKIVRHFDPEKRDTMIAMFKDEPHAIDSTLEVINAVTDLINEDLLRDAYWRDDENR